MERKGVVLRLGCTASVAGSMVVLKLDPPRLAHACSDQSPNKISIHKAEVEYVINFLLTGVIVVY